MTAEQLIKTISSSVAKAFEIEGMIRPTFFWVNANGDRRRIRVPGVLIESKNAWIMFGRGVLKQDGAIAAAMVSEAWSKSFKSEEEAMAQTESGGSLEYADGREEIVSFMGEDETGCVTAQMRINRPTDGRRAYLERLEVINRYEGVLDGRFVGLLPNREGSKAN